MSKKVEKLLKALEVDPNKEYLFLVRAGIMAEDLVDAGSKMGLHGGIVRVESLDDLIISEELLTWQTDQIEKVLERLEAGVGLQDELKDILFINTEITKIRLEIGRPRKEKDGK